MYESCIYFRKNIGIIKINYGLFLNNKNQLCVGFFKAFEARIKIKKGNCLF
jgi:hypothetical protein